jgi:hypothetical protein
LKELKFLIHPLLSNLMTRVELSTDKISLKKFAKAEKLSTFAIRSRKRGLEIEVGTKK